ncbi:MAG: LLM class flavin-dependent oxidoreductase [Desulfurellaceae bacterium]|nr:LLM class flavin-dependent oxidoreductase [Desulfurellaceae bacterium]
MTQKPAIALVAVAGRRKQTLDVATQIEKEGFSGIYCQSVGDCIGLCEALAFTTNEIPFGTSIANMYTRHPYDFAQTVALIHEVSGGRFRFGVGVSHGPMLNRLKVKAGKPLADMRQFVSDLHASVGRKDALPPVILATLRKAMVKLSAEISQGAVWANAARSHMATSLSFLPQEKMQDDGFFVGNMIPTIISDDKEAAAKVHRRTLSTYVRLPNYQQYWIEAGYEEEMRAIQQAMANKEDEKIPSLMSDRWLSQVTLYGSVSEVRAGVEAWYDTGLKTPILVPSSANGNQMVALQEVMAAFR